MYPRAAVAVLAAQAAFRQAVAGHERGVDERQEHQLGDSLQRVDRIRLIAQVHQLAANLAAVAGVDDSRRVCQRNAVVAAESRARCLEREHALRHRQMHSVPTQTDFKVRW